MDTGTKVPHVAAAKSHAKPLSPAIAGGCLRTLDLLLVGVVGISVYFAYVYSSRGGGEYPVPRLAPDRDLNLRHLLPMARRLRRRFYLLQEAPDGPHAPGMGDYRFYAFISRLRAEDFKLLFAGLGGHMVCRDSWNVELNAGCSQLLDPQVGKRRPVRTADCDRRCRRTKRWSPRIGQL